MAKYKIISFEKAEPPQGAGDKNWYQYVIQNDLNTITSFRSGSKSEVRQFAIEATKRLNEKYACGYKVKSYNRPVNENTFAIYL